MTPKRFHSTYSLEILQVAKLEAPTVELQTEQITTLKHNEISQRRSAKRKHEKWQHDDDATMKITISANYDSHNQIIANCPNYINIDVDYNSRK